MDELRDDTKSCSRASASNAATTNRRQEGGTPSRRSAGRRASFARRSPLGSVEVASEQPVSASLLIQNMRRAMRVLHSVSTEILEKASQELHFDSKQLEEIQKQLNLLESPWAAEGSPIEEKFIAITAEFDSINSGQCEDVPAKRACLESSRFLQASDAVEPMIMLARRLEEWGKLDVGAELKARTAVEPLPPYKSVDVVSDAKPDLLDEERLAILRVVASEKEVAQRHIRRLANLRAHQLKKLPQHAITVERLARRLAAASCSGASNPLSL